MKKILLSIVLCLFIPSVYAQLEITGRVLFNSDKSPASGASIVAYDGDSLIESTIADKEGAFMLSIPSYDTIEIRVSMLGCKALSIIIDNVQRTIKLGDLWLEEDAELLDEVVVTARNETIQKMVVYPKKRELSSSSDVMSLLNNMSLRGLFINLSGQVATVYGKAVQWQINGVPKSKTEVLSIIPEKILRFEYTDMPGARYLDKGIGGVINIVLKEQIDGGSFSVHAQPALTTGFFNGNTGLSYNIGKHALSFNYNLSHRNYKNRLYYSEESYIGGTNEVKREHTPIKSPFGYDIHNISLSYLYQANPNRQYSITLSDEIYDEHTKVQGYVIETNQPEYFRTNRATHKNNSPSVDFYFSNRFDNGGKLEVNVVGSYRKGDMESGVLDMIGDRSVREFSNPVDYTRKALIGEVFYTQQINSSLNLTTGLQYQLGHSENTYFSPREFTDVLQEDNSYLYVQLSGMIENFQYAVGTGLKRYIVKNTADKKQYYKNQSTATLLYSLNTTTYLRLASSYMPMLPSLSQLSDVTQRYDNLLAYKGNPKLSTAQYVHNRLGLYYNNNNIAQDMEVTYYRIWNPILYNVTYNSADDNFISQAVNGNYDQQVGVSWKSKIMNIWNHLSIYTTLGYNFQSSDTGSSRHYLNSLYWDISAMLQHKEWSLAYYYVKPPKTLYNNTISRGENSSRLTLIWKRNNLTLYTAVHFPFTPKGSTYENTFLSKTNPKKTYVNILDNRNMITLGLSWNIDFGKKLNQSRRTLYNSDTDNSILSTAIK